MTNESLSRVREIRVDDDSRHSRSLSQVTVTICRIIGNKNNAVGKNNDNDNNNDDDESRKKT